MNRWNQGLMACAVLVAGLALAQQDESQPVADDADLEVLEEELTEATEEPTLEDELAQPIDGEAAVDPLAEIEAQERRAVDASMDRFEPSEEISQDRSVAFPNDI